MTSRDLVSRRVRFIAANQSPQKDWQKRHWMERWGVFHRIAAVLPLLVAPLPAVEIRVATFNIGAHFNENFFDYSLGDPGTPDHESVRDILARIDADVVALQEIHSVDLQGAPNDLQVLAASLGYPYLNIPPVTGVFDTSLRVVFLSRYPFLQSTSIVSPDGARDMTRRHAVVKVDLPGITDDPWLVTPHMKAGTTLADRFRRAVEMRRLVNDLAARGIDGNDNFVVLGDFNPSSIQATFNELPEGLPGTFVLGNDISYPVTYRVNPVDYFSPSGVFRLDARQADGSPTTFGSGSGGPTLDIILVSPTIAARNFAAEIYNSALDVSNETGLPKYGSPLAAATSSTASDHLAVFADLNILPTGPYAFHQPGEVISENFGGITGVFAPRPWSTDGGGWLGIDDGSSNAPGWRAYGDADDAAPGFVSNGEPARISATFENRSLRPLTALKIQLDAKQWRAVNGGAADRIAAELILPGQVLSLPDLTFTAATNLPTGPRPESPTAVLTSLIRGLWIAPGASFNLRISFLPGAEGGTSPEDVFINEFHYDNTGTDSGEFVEIAVGPGYNGNLSDISLLLYNGSDGAVYGTHTLNTFTAGQATSSGHRIYHKLISGIQNGSPDGFALVTGTTVRQFISYEGVINATSGAAAGLASIDVSVAQNGTEPLGESAITLVGSGAYASDFNWVKSATGIAHSPGAANAGQTFVNPAKPPQGLAFDNLAVTYLTDNDLDGDPDITDPDDDNDAQADVEEIAFGTDPFNPTKRFKPLLTRTAQGGLQLSFPGTQGIAYTVEFSDNLTAWQNLSTVVGAGETIVVPLPMAAPAMFYRVRAGGPAS